MSKSLCYLAFETLQNRLCGSSFNNYDLMKKILREKDEIPLKTPLFITWNKNGDLRGCIGTFEDLEVVKGTKRFAIVSAMEDPRFPPVSKSELKELSVSVTLLCNFESIYAWDNWEVGKHGLKINMKVNGRYYSGTFLPSVAEEQHWDKETTLSYLLRKAGYNGVPQQSTVKFFSEGLVDKSVNLIRYKGIKEEMSFEDFIELSSSLQ